MTKAEQAGLLVAKADEDIHLLTVLQKDSQTSDAIWGFHAQQAVEKLLKSLLTFHGAVFPFTHRLLELADLLADRGHGIAEQFDPLLDLTPYDVELRYSILPADSSAPPLDRAALLRRIPEFQISVRAAIGR